MSQPPGTRVSARLQQQKEKEKQQQQDRPVDNRAPTSSTSEGSRSKLKRDGLLKQDIQKVQALIERCLNLYMPEKDVVQTLHAQAKIEPGFTRLVWQKLEEQNRDFFHAYYLRLKLKEHIQMFNYLLEQQQAMMSQLHSSWMQAMPTLMAQSAAAAAAAAGSFPPMMGAMPPGGLGMGMGMPAPMTGLPGSLAGGVTAGTQEGMTGAAAPAAGQPASSSAVGADVGRDNMPGTVPQHLDRARSLHLTLDAGGLLGAEDVLLIDGSTREHHQQDSDELLQPLDDEPGYDEVEMPGGQQHPQQQLHMHQGSLRHMSHHDPHNADLLHLGDDLMEGLVQGLGHEGDAAHMDLGGPAPLPRNFSDLDLAGWGTAPADIHSTSFMQADPSAGHALEEVRRQDHVAHTLSAGDMGRADSSSPGAGNMLLDSGVDGQQHAEALQLQEEQCSMSLPNEHIAPQGAQGTTSAMEDALGGLAVEDEVSAALGDPPQHHAAPHAFQLPDLDLNAFT